MIRDPSDGSVKEKPDLGIPISTGIIPAIEPGMTSGLQTGTSRPGEIERLNKSREWLKAYHRAQSSTASTETPTDHPSTEGK